MKAPRPLLRLALLGVLVFFVWGAYTPLFEYDSFHWRYYVLYFLPASLVARHCRSAEGLHTVERPFDSERSQQFFLV